MTQHRRVSPGSRASRSAGLAAVAIVAVSVAAPHVTWGAEPVPGSAGTDTSLPPTDSQVTVSGRGKFSDLEVTVNQTRSLSNQAVSVTWTGGAPTEKGARQFGEHFLQMFQCWGDPADSNPDNPGPPPEQCQQGATNGVFGGGPISTVLEGETTTRVISAMGAPNFDPSLGTLDEFGGVSLPFRAVDGTVVPQWRDLSFNPQLGGGNYWLNTFFNIITTNEIAGARTAPDRTGAELFEVTTGLESNGLGCGQKVQKVSDGSTKVPQCWLVVVPRGSAADENAGSIFVSPNFGVATSPVAPAAWRNRIAIPLAFNPLESSCALSAEQRRLVGSELFSAAVSSWQPALCATPGLPPYAYGAIGDSRARQQILSGTPGAPGMAVVSRPIDPSTADPRSPIVYAPLTVSGVVIGFNVERIPDPNRAGGISEELEAIRGVRVAQLSLTPRLVAKLLTQSYRSQVDIGNTKAPYRWSEQNPRDMTTDQDFLQFNPEFEILSIGFPKNMGALVIPAPNSDAARQVWEWILSDPEARTWLAGESDPWGMNVNPIYSTSPSVNPAGASFGDPLPDQFPKSDPHCFQGPKVGARLDVTPPLICGLDWLPYTQSLRDSARAIRAANDAAKTVPDRFALSSDKVYQSDGPQGLGQRAMLSITDTPSAAQFGLQTARLSRAGDNGSDREFIAPDQNGLVEALDGFAPTTVDDVLEPSPTTTPPGGYPLTALTYAAVAPLGLDEKARGEYADLVEYAAGPGQEPGLQFGQLPPGYAPLPDVLRIQGLIASVVIRELEAIDEPTAARDAGPGSVGGAASPDDGLAAGPLPSTPESLAPAAPSTPSTAQRTPNGPLDIVTSALKTPAYKLAATRFALPVFIVLSLLAALGSLEITQRRNRPMGLDATGGFGSAVSHRVRRLARRRTAGPDPPSR